MKRHPDQPPLFWLCDICGWPHIDPREHRSCGAALSRWFRPDNHDSWADEPNRALL